MKKRLLLLGGCFVAFYYLIRVAYDMPNLVHGNPQFLWLPEGRRGWVERVWDILYYFLFTLTAYWALHRWYPQRKTPYAVLLISTCLPAIFLLRFWIERHGIGRGMRLKTYFLNNIFYVVLFVIFGVVFYFIRYSYYRDIRQKELEIQNRESELSFLRSQVNPHFLFNSLNNIYSLVYQRSEQALTAIAGLSDLLRYMLYDVTEKVPLAKEVDYIQKYIQLQRLRFDHAIRADVSVEGNTADVLIEPLLLIPFVENAFKHGDLSSIQNGLSLTVHADAKKTYFHCANPIGTHQKDAGGGIGLENVKRRLDLLYPGKHTLSILEDSGRFIVKLELTYE